MTPGSNNTELGFDDIEFDANEAAHDATALLRDDVLLDALAKGVFPVEYADDAMVNALWDWREDVVGGPVQLDTSPALAAAQALQATPEPVVDELAARRARRFGFGRRLAISIAAAFVGFGALGSVAAASVAEPGDTMFPLTKVVNSKRATSLEAREHAVDKLNNARAAARHDNPQVARKHIAAALADAEKVRNRDGKEDLQQQLVALQAELATPLPTKPSDPAGTPSPSDPSPSPSPSPSDPSPSPSPSPSPTGSPNPSDSLPPSGSAPATKPRSIPPTPSGSGSDSAS